jgi:hypothetical protein
MRRVFIPAVAAVLATASAVSAQTAPQTPPSVDQTVPAVTAAPVGEDWNAVSRSATRAYLVDVNSLKTEGDVTSIVLVRAPLNPPTPTDRSYVSVEMEYRCAAKESRTVAETDHDATGAAQDRIETGEEFEGYGPESLFGFIGAVTCDGARASPPTFPSIAAFMDAGRP